MDAMNIRSRSLKYHLFTFHTIDNIRKNSHYDNNPNLYLKSNNIICGRRLSETMKNISYLRGTIYERSKMTCPIGDK